MLDVRTLLKAKRQEIRIDHPLASYTSSGQLRCIVCETNIKHPSAWDGHLGSKAHRTNAARLREEEKRQKELAVEEEQHLKRKAPDEDVGNITKKPRTAPAHDPLVSSLPSDFFSDPSRAPLSLPDNSDEEDETEHTVPVTQPTPDENSSLEQEWMRFQQTVINAPVDAIATYDHATIVAEPELVTNSSEGFPTRDDAHAQPVTKTEEDNRRQKEKEERELIMDRLMDEERAQEEADMKVTVMKNKLEALRKRREAARSSNPKPNLGVA